MGALTVFNLAVFLLATVFANAGTESQLHPVLFKLPAGELSLTNSDPSGNALKAFVLPIESMRGAHISVAANIKAQSTSWSLERGTDEQNDQPAANKTTGFNPIKPWLKENCPEKPEPNETTNVSVRHRFACADYTQGKVFYRGRQGQSGMGISSAELQ